MKKQKFNTLFLLSIVSIVITGAINVYGYFNLPEKMATQFSFSGGKVNVMPKSAYLIVAFAIVFILSLLSMKGEREQKIKYFLVALLIVVANIVMIVIQL